MKTQCSFTLFGNTWTCLREDRPNEIGFGGECDIANKRICVCKEYEPETFLNYLHHELMEGALFLNACVFHRFFPDKKELFVMDHAQMDVVSGAVRGAYEEIKQNIGINLAIKNTKAHKESELRNKAVTKKRKKSIR